MDAAPADNVLSRTGRRLNQRLQVLLDRSSPHITARWSCLVFALLCYIARVWYLRGFYIVSYGLGIYNLNLLLGFITPQFDPELEGPELPTKADAEFRPFVRRLPEFKFWYSSFKSVLIGIAMTFSSVFDVPVFWPILLLYWFVLFFVTMKRQIRHMVKHRYLPFSFGKKRYGKGPAVKDSK
ncbi:Protein RER1C [Tetrabaena socialis]|uniref:Protein RER1 n=1 Tax=Tetrabaena socialis TaxID=47790 RepID=A0A2J7ZVF2_9CHLO|nr:Protein RER1C [Tetrabaena socialis]|eukprot:PNH04244.1 Protein RER1C [Tetrabaena socialis]